MSSALAATEAVAGGKDVWITETGWAYTGGNFGAAESTVNNAAKYWKDVGCALFGRKNVFWYTLRDANPANKVKFAITDNLSTKPRYDLSCPEKKTLPSPNTNGTYTGNSTSTTNNSPSGSGNASPSSSTGAARASGTAGGNGVGANSVSVVNAMTMMLSVVFAMAAWAL